MLHSRIFALTAVEETAFGISSLNLLYIVGALAVLCLLIQIGHYLRHHRSNADVDTEIGTASAPSDVSAAPSSSAPANNAAVIAAITAAIAAAMAEEGYTGGFRVVSFKRVPNRRRNRF